MTSSIRPAVDASAFRAQFPVLERLSYLNAGTEGPIPSAAVHAVQRRIEEEATGGRGGRVYFAELLGMAARVRAAYARTLGCAPEQVALTGSTTDGVNTVIGGFDFRAGDEILTTDEEHPGLLAPLAGAQRRHGVSVRVVPFAEIAGEVSSATRMIACSHVSWVSGRVVEAVALARTGVPVLLDGAQALGAVPVNVEALGCAFYAASGQKWMCGPEGSGCLFVHPDHLAQLTVPWPWYGSLANPAQALQSEPAIGVARLHHGFPSGLRSAFALASIEVFEQAGWGWVNERAADLAAWLADGLAEGGLEVWPRGRSTLVSWKVDDAAGDVERLAGMGIVVRSIPGAGLVRASVGAWSSEEELARLVEVAAGGYVSNS